MKIESKKLNDLILNHQLWLEHNENGEILKLSNEHITRLNLSKHNLSYSTYFDCVFDNVIFDSLNMSNTIFENCKFIHCNFIDCNFICCIMKNNDFEYTNMYFNNLSESKQLQNSYILSDILLNDIDKIYFDKCNFQNSNIDYNTYAQFPIGLNDCIYISNNTNYKEQILKNNSLSYEQTLINKKTYAEQMLKQYKNSTDKSEEYILVEKLLLETSKLDIENELKKQNIFTKTNTNKETQKSTNKSISKSQSNLTKAIKENINLLDYAKSLGYTVIKVGNQLSLKEYKDTIRINPSTQYPGQYVFIRHSTGQSGSVIDFEMMVNNCSQDQAIKNLRKLLPSSQDIAYYKSIDTPKLEQRIKEEKNSFKLPDKFKGKFKRVLAYLSTTRKIDYGIILDLFKSGYLYEDTRHNAVFVGYNKENIPAYACVRGTIPDKRYVGEVKNSNKEIGFLLDNKSNKYFIAESVIDNLSIATLIKSSGNNYKKYNYLSLGGVNTKPISYHLKDCDNIKDFKFYIATDNDKAGTKSRHDIKSTLLSLGANSKNIFDKIPLNKDFNEDLQRLNSNLPKTKKVNIFVAPKTSNKIVNKQLYFEYER